MSRVTLSRYLIEQTRSHNTPADLRFLIEVVARACKEISHAVSKGALGGVLGSMGTENVQGEVQKKLDVMSNEILLEANEWAGNLAGMASEEMDHPYQIPGRYPKGAYLLVFDPLDGSSNIDVNVSVGTIFSVLRCPSEYLNQNDTLREEAFLQPGTTQVAAGYAIYGPQTMLMLTLGNGVKGFTLDRELGSFVLTHDNISVPESTAEFAINMSNQRHWEAPVKRYVEELLAGKGRPAGQELQHALDRLDGRRRPPHPDPWWRLHVPARRPRAGEARQAAPDVRSQPDVVHHRAGRRRRHQRHPAHPRHQAGEPAPACRGVPRLEAGSRAHHRLPRGVGR